MWYVLPKYAMYEKKKKKKTLLFFESICPLTWLAYDNSTLQSRKFMHFNIEFRPLETFTIHPRLGRRKVILKCHSITFSFLYSYLLLSQTTRAPLTVVCDGFYSTFRKQFSSLSKPKEPLACIGLQLGEVTFPNGKHWVHMFLGNPLAAYFVYSIGDNAFRILVEVLGESPKDVTGFLRNQLAPTMPG